MYLKSKKNHYLYVMRDSYTGEYYIGVRSCNCDPFSDVGYTGSGGWHRLKGSTGDFESDLQKRILMTFDTRGEAVLFESFLIKERMADALCKNRTHDKVMIRPKVGVPGVVYFG